jgi:hypothetical protein
VEPESASPAERRDGAGGAIGIARPADGLAEVEDRGDRITGACRRDDLAEPGRGIVARERRETTRRMFASIGSVERPKAIAATAWDM